MALSLLLAAACSSSSGGGNQSVDATSGDATGSADSTDVVDGNDGSDISTATDGLDSSTSLDGLDQTDAMDSTESSDATDGADQVDGLDQVDSTDTADAADSADATDASTAGAAVYGGVLISQVEDPNLSLGSVTVAFSLTPTPAPDIVTESGDCYVHKPLAEMAAPAGLSIGELTFSGLSQPLVMTPSGNKQYSSGLADDHPSILSSEPEVVIEAGGGEDLDAVTVTLPVPSSVSVTSPTSDVQQNQPLTISWAADSVQNLPVRLDLVVYDGDGNQKDGNLVTCELDNDPGSYTISPALLAELPVGGGFGPFAIDVLVVGVTRVQSKEVALSGSAGTGSATFAITRSAGTGVLIQ
jgi:hypothetical protein